MKYSNFKLSGSRRLLIGFVLISLMTMSILPLIGVQTNETRASAWGNNPYAVTYCDSTSTHDKIMQAAITMLYLHGYYSEYSVYNGYRTYLCNAQAVTDTRSDVHSTYGTTSSYGHSWHLWDSSQYPLTAFNAEFGWAKSASTDSGKIWYLGRALHFVQDMTQPYHAGGIGVDEDHLEKDRHFLFEAAATALDASSLLSPILYGSMSNGHNNGERFFYEALNNGIQLLDYVRLFPSTDPVSPAELAIAQTGINIATQLTAGLMLFFYYNYYNAPSGGGGTGGLHPL